jgi:hypothetical protein
MYEVSYRRINFVDKVYPKYSYFGKKNYKTVTGSFRTHFPPNSGAHHRHTYVALFFMERLRKWDGPRVGRYPK